MYFFVYLLTKTNRFHFAVVCSVIDAQRTSQRGKNISDQLLCSYIPRCDVICASITEQTTAKWNLFVNYIFTAENGRHVRKTSI